MPKLTVYLADLFHEQSATEIDVSPLGVGYIGNALKVSCGDDVDVRLFKYPHKLQKAIESKPPDILGLTNYTWNAELQLRYGQLMKEISPETIVLMGGPNIRFEKEGLEKFLKDHPQVDGYVPLAGEVPTVNFVRALLNQLAYGDKPDLRPINVEGVYLRVPGYKFKPRDEKLNHENLEFGSPILSGILDEFIADPHLMPMTEITRGCPYACTFCAWGVSALSRLIKRKLEVVLAEFQHQIDHGAGQKLWYFADANFGILPIDEEVSRGLAEFRNKYGTPQTIIINWAKSSSSKRVVDMVNILGDMTTAQIAMQSFDKEVLKNIKRVNLRDDAIDSLIEKYRASGASVATDILFPCSGETHESHLQTLKSIFDYGFDNANINMIRMLPGTEMESDADRSKYGFKTKFRVIANAYGIYGGKFVSEIEEGICGSNTLSWEEFLRLRVIHFMIYTLWSTGMARDILKLGLAHGISPIDCFLYVIENNRLEAFNQILKDLRHEMASEWFDSKEDLLKYYSHSDRQKDIIEGEGRKLVWKYIAKLLCSKETVFGLIRSVARYLAGENKVNRDYLEIVEKISLDKIKLDFEAGDKLNKMIRYEISEKQYRYLVKHKIIPNNLECSNGALAIHYRCDTRKYQYFQEILERYNYREMPAKAIYSAFHYGLVEQLNFQMTPAVEPQPSRRGTV